MLLILVLQVAIIIQFQRYRTELDRVIAVVESPVEIAAQQAAPAPQTAPQTVSYPHSIHSHMNRMFLNALSEFERMEHWTSLDDGWASLAASPAMDMREFDDNYVVLFGLPAGTRDNLKITLDGRLLTVFVTSPYDGAPHIFERRIWLPGPVNDSEDTIATLTNNMLKVVLPKATADINNRTPVKVF